MWGALPPLQIAFLSCCVSMDKGASWKEELTWKSPSICFVSLLFQDHRPHHQMSYQQHGGRSRRTESRGSTTTTPGMPSSNPPASSHGIRAITNKAPLTIRPFAAIYNPYSKSCSVLCNHPATAELKTVVKHAKQSLVSPALGRGYQEREDWDWEANPR